MADKKMNVKNISIQTYSKAKINAHYTQLII
jgi:hypothetical protein